ncbi:MAG: hypothetical protein JWO55_376 [Candidatus Saccharibacteria bacterium]|jgi:hypothetical protein|nr:hypothetical protein [Candidatus Saccharibacteria bacterium]
MPQVSLYEIRLASSCIIAQEARRNLALTSQNYFRSLVSFYEAKAANDGFVVGIAAFKSLSQCDKQAREDAEVDQDVADRQIKEPVFCFARAAKDDSLCAIKGVNCQRLGLRVEHSVVGSEIIQVKDLATCMHRIGVVDCAGGLGQTGVENIQH